MCTVNLTRTAEPMVAELLIRLRDALAAEYGEDPESCRIGPVDLGTEP